MKKAFTLAEVMIVMTVIGILTAILMPIAYHSTPDENVMQFKKATTTLGTVVREMVPSDQYFQDADMSKLPGGTASSSTNVCNAMIDILNYKSANCGSTNSASASNVQATTPDGVQWFYHLIQNIQVPTLGKRFVLTLTESAIMKHRLALRFVETVK